MPPDPPTYGMSDVNPHLTEKAGSAPGYCNPFESTCIFVIFGHWKFSDGMVKTIIIV